MLSTGKHSSLFRRRSSGYRKTSFITPSTERKVERYWRKRRMEIEICLEKFVAHIFKICSNAAQKF